MQRTPSPTPDSSGVIAAPDTLPRPRQTSAPLYRTGDLTYGREAVLRDLQSVFIVDLSYFKAAVLPPFPDKADIKLIRSSLTSSKTLTPAGRWAAFDVDPKSAPRNEDAVFRGLGSVFEDIVKVVQTSVGHPTLQLELNPSVAPQSERSNSSRPDGYLRLVKKKSVSSTPDLRKDSWDDIAVSFEFKKGATTDARVDNDKKIIWSLHHVMRSDPCRRATFGITIENTQTRLWFTCRSMTLVSRPFDFTKDIENVIHVFCCLAFAPDHELGWDPTIERVLVKDVKDGEDEIQYQITIGDNVYQTLATISDFGAEAMRGRGTRVFKAYELSHPDKHIVIKDAWRDSDRKREDQILSDILHDIWEQDGDEAVVAARKYFLTVLNAEDVKIHGCTDDTEQLLRGAALPDTMLLYNISPDRVPSQLSHTSSIGNLPQFPFRRVIAAPGSGKIHHKQHFRLVFDELGEPIFKLNNLRDVSQTLDRAVKGLRYLHKAGWVHRDISSANVLRYGDRGLIMDLEYAKKMDSSDLSHDVRTGTLDFMACEVEAQKYLFISQRLELPDDEAMPALTLVARPPFHANPLHDLESSWWILMWVLHYHVDGDTRESPPKQEATYLEYFPGLPLALGGRSRLGSLSTQLDPNALSKSFYRAAVLTDHMRESLYNAYRAAEANPLGVAFLTPYLTSSTDFSNKLANWKSIPLVPLSDIKKLGEI
ncbi:hypothetical protein BU15DRAFT_49861 [Melanogaster broomeanus]|nr:hypothetical protein BU15DRAFT_49861 [Melanogaster broomeanus]